MRTNLDTGGAATGGIMVAADEWRLWFAASFETVAPRWQPVGVMDIIELVSQCFHVPVKTIQDRRKRDQHTAIARQVAMYATRRLTTFSFPAIGICFRRDHSTVIHAYQAVSRRMEREPQFRRTVEGLLARVGSA